MTLLEDALRQTFAGQVTDLPEVRDRAGSAIARARTVRRRQRTAAGTALVLAITMVASGTWLIRTGRPDRVPSAALTADALPADVAGTPPAAGRATASPIAPGDRISDGPSLPAGAPLPLDFVVGGELRPATGAPIALPGAGDVYDAVQVPEGWLVVRGGDKSTHKLWLVRRSGGPTLLLDALPSVFYVSPDARRIAYQKGSTITVAAMTTGRLTVERTTQVPGTDGSQGRTGAELAGWAGRYLVIGNRLGISYDGFDVWDPTGGGYTPTWNRDVAGVYAATPDGRSVIGSIRDTDPRKFCTAVLDPTAGLRPRGALCGQPPVDVYLHPLSPDGRRFIARAGPAVGIADTATGALTATVAPTEGVWPAVPVWFDNDTFVIAEKDRVVRVEVADPGNPRQLPAPSTSEHWLVVARAAG